MGIRDGRRVHCHDSSTIRRARPAWDRTDAATSRQAYLGNRVLQGAASWTTRLDTTSLLPDLHI